MKYSLLTPQKNSSWLKYSLLLLFTCYLAIGTVNAAKGRVYITLLKLQPVAKKVDNYQVQAYKAQVNIKYQLTDYLQEALLNGVTLTANLEFYYHQPSNWFWDKKKPLADLSFQLKYHALSRHYLLSRDDTNEYWNFGNLPATLRKMGEIRNYYLPNLEPRTADDDSYITAIASFEPSRLDLPLRLQSLMSNEYSLVSQEARWPLP
jgi:hypothetical protein